jgi:hypothetical protein
VRLAAASERRRALVARHRGRHWAWTDDQVHDCVLCYRAHRRNAPDSEPPLFSQRLVLVRRGAGAAHRRTQPLVAIPAPLRRPCLDAQHPHPRHWPGPHRQLSPEAVLERDQPCYSSALARRAVVSLCAARRQTVAHARLDVRAYAGAPDGRADATTTLPRPTRCCSPLVRHGPKPGSGRSRRKGRPGSCAQHG